MNRNDEKNDKLTRDQVLALDIATHCGYHSTHGSGTWNFEDSMRRNGNRQYAQIRDTLMNFVQEHGIKRIVAEEVSAGNAKGGFKTSVKLATFHGVVMEVCDRLGLPRPVYINPITLKKWATGDSKADKAKMIDFCIKRWGLVPVDDNEADATHIFMYYIRKNYID